MKRMPFLTLLILSVLSVGLGFGRPAVAAEEPPGQPEAGSDVANQLRVNLYATLEFVNMQNADSFFDARNVELLINANMGSRLKGFAEIEFERTAKTSAGNRQGEVEVEQGWIEFVVTDWLGVRGGVILVPFGRINLEHFDTVRELTARPVMARRVVPTTWAEAGAGLVGQASSGELVISYQAYVINGLNDDAGISDTGGLRDSRGAFGKDNNNNKAVVGRVAVSPRYGTEIGVSGYHGQYANSRAANGLDADLRVTMGAVELLGEYAYIRLDSGPDNGLVPVAVPTKLHGAYAQIAYRFWLAFLNQTFLGRGFSEPMFALVGQWGYAAISDDGDGAGLGEADNRTMRYVAGVNYRPTQTFVFKVEYQWNTQAGEAVEQGGSNGVLASMTAAF
ncbi:MAG: hypothetical protein AB1515_02640 [Nitrospirota bacterium]